MSVTSWYRRHRITARAACARGASSGGRLLRPSFESLEARIVPTLTWSSLPALPTQVYGVAAATDAQGRIYAIGGNNGNFSATVDRYDPSTPDVGWIAVASMNSTRFDAATISADDGTIYVFGGHPAGAGSSPSVEHYDPANNIWNDVAPM